jgi:EpsG family
MSPVTTAPVPAPPRPAHLQFELELVLFLSLGTIALLLVYPLAAFALATLLLLNLPSHTPRYARLTLAAAAAVALAMMTGARPLDPDSSNDIDGYYDIYKELTAGDLNYLTNFGGGLEVALPLLLWVWGLLLPPLTINGLMFCLALTSSLLVMIWVEETFYAEQGGLKRPALMGVCLLMLNLYFSTQLSRQFLSLIVLLFALSAQGRMKQLVFVALASAFHVTAIPFFGMYLLVKRGPRGWVFLIALAIGLRLFFVQLVAAFDIVPAAVAEKLLYYVDNADDAGASDLASLRMIFLLGLVSFLGVAAGGFRLDPKSRRWLAAPWITGLVHVVLLPIPLASLRVTLMIHSVMPGLIAYKMLEGRPQRALPVLLNALFFYKMAAFVTAEQSGNLLSTLSMLNGFVQ